MKLKIKLHRPSSTRWRRILSLAIPLQKLALLLSGRHIRAVSRALFKDNDCEYWKKNPDLTESGLLPFLDYLLFGLAELRDPHPLFDTQFYLQQNPDVQVSGVNPFLHYVRFGAKEGRNPHPLFDTGYYVSRNDDVLATNANPFLHFVTIGQFKDRQCHAAFNPRFYRMTKLPALAFNAGGLLDYLDSGYNSGAAPSAEFDPRYYLALHKDVSDAGYEPLAHYIAKGRKEGRAIRPPRFESGDDRNYFPSHTGHRAPHDVQRRPVDVIIPIHQGFEETRACLESVIAAANSVPMQLVLINDASPDAELCSFLRAFAAAHAVQLIEHERNAGFVVAVNEGMKLHPDRDVVLLNGDTQVFSDWLDRLAAHAYSGDRIASATPFSNNATICSYPRPLQSNAVPPGTSAGEIDAVFRNVNAGRRCAIPTAVGFCMYIRRDALDDAGLFDEAAFGLGYGEENDWCERTLDRKWIHLLAADTFVFHAGEVSFGKASANRSRGMAALLAKHPDYLTHIDWHIRTDPANAFRIAVTAQRVRNSRMPVRMNVVHSLGGGTLDHVNRLEQLTRGDVLWLRLSPAPDGHIRLGSEQPGFEFAVSLHPELEYSLLVRLLRSFGVERVHVHHALGLPVDIDGLISEIGVPFDVTLHDYYFVCPRVTMTDDAGRYCAADASCQNCSSSMLPGGESLDLLSWRAKWTGFLLRASRVISPSADTKARFESLCPGLNAIAAWHENISKPVEVRTLEDSEPLRVAVLGLMTAAKGYPILDRCAVLARETQASVEFLQIGGIEPRLEAAPRTFESTSWYKPEELQGLLDRYKPHLAWFPAQWPETFSYTLSECFVHALPVVVPDLGAFAERVSGRDWSWVLPWNTTPEEWLAFFVQVRGNHFLKRVPPPVSSCPVSIDKQYYPLRFLNGKQQLTTA